MTENVPNLGNQSPINDVKCQTEPVVQVIEEEKPQETRPGVLLLKSWLNKSFRVEMTDGRILIGIFVCTDRDSNIILGSCSEYLPVDSKGKAASEEPRILGLVMIPGKHIVSLQIDCSDNASGAQKPLKKEVSEEEVM